MPRHRKTLPGTRAGRACLAALLALGVAGAAPPPGRVPPARLAMLRHGLNIVHWFRFPPAADPASLRGYVADATLAALRRDGFTFLRIPIQPEVLAGPDGNLDGARVALLVEQLRRIERAGLAVMPELHPQAWHLETSLADQARLVAIWRDLAVSLRGLDPDLTFPEILNEPIFPDAAAAWDAQQARALAAIRASLPGVTIVLTGTNWSDIDGLLKAHPPADRNVVYAVHFYEPFVLTVGAPQEPAVDAAALGTMPFPADDPAACAHTADAAPAGRTRDIMLYYCSLHADEAAIAARLAAAADWSHRHGIPLVMNEFGITDHVAPSTRRAFLAAVRHVAERDGFGWALWGYDDSMGLDLPVTAARTAAPIDAGLLTALGLP